MANELKIVNKNLYRGNKFLYGGRVDPLPGGSSITTVTGRAQIRPEKGEALIHDFSPLVFVEDGDGYTFTPETLDTDDWPYGKLWCDIELDVDSGGPLLVCRVIIDVLRTVTYG